MSPSDAIELEAFYAYGYMGRDMIAVRAPFPMAAEASEIIGRRTRIARRCYVVLGVARQIAGPIHKGEPIGIEVREAPAEGQDEADLRFRSCAEAQERAPERMSYISDRIRTGG